MESVLSFSLATAVGSYTGLLNLNLLGFFALSRNWGVIRTHIDTYLLTATFTVGVAFFSSFQIVRYLTGLYGPAKSSEEFQAKPLIFPCRTTHTRLFPKTHSFSYSYLWVGVPVGWKGSVGGMISSDTIKDVSPWYRRLLSLKFVGAWFTINGDDYLGRGHVGGGLQEKLQVYLRSKDINTEDYPYAYLITAPRFLGYASNPVSVWNLYSSTKELKAFILEVNNTFDERHIYFVEPESVSSEPPRSEVPPKLVKSWPKDFYVSVFNDRAGKYSLSATDPFFPNLNGSGTINTTVTIKSPHASLVARIFSTDAPLDPSKMSVWSKTVFILTWGWVGLATFPRTVVQALTLLLRRKMPWVFRPEPRKDTMPRHADATEVFVESIFRKYLQHFMDEAGWVHTMKYSPAGLIDGSKITMRTPSCKLEKRKRLPNGVVPIPECELGCLLDIKVLTPSFYSRLVHYSSNYANHYIRLEQKVGTVTASSLYRFFEITCSELNLSNNVYAKFFQSPRWWLLQTLRKAPVVLDAVTSPEDAHISHGVESDDDWSLAEDEKEEVQEKDETDDQSSAPRSKIFSDKLHAQYLRIDLEDFHALSEKEKYDMWSARYLDVEPESPRELSEVEVEEMITARELSREFKVLDPSVERQKKRKGGLSGFELFIRTHCSKEEQNEYVSRVLKMFISERIAFGWIELLDLEIFLVKCGVAWVAAGWLTEAFTG